MRKNIITISREFGSGGRTIGKEVAKRLNIPFYDKELIEKVARGSGLNVNYIEEHGEYAPSSNPFAYAFLGHYIDGMSMNDYIWMMQRKIILELVQEGPCVIVGRCADYILRDRDDCFNVFICSDLDKKVERIVRLYGETDEKPEKRLADKDKKRRANYKYYTDQVWGLAQNYHLCLNSGEIGIDKCTELIVDLVK